VGTRHEELTVESAVVYTYTREKTDTEAHFYTREYQGYLFSRKKPPRAAMA